MSREHLGMLLEHTKHETDYLQQLSEMEDIDPQLKEALGDYVTRHVGPRARKLRRMISKFEQDEGGSDEGETGEAALVGRGRVPPELDEEEVGKCWASIRRLNRMLGIDPG